MTVQRLTKGATAHKIGERIKPGHKTMARALGFALTVGEADAWAAFSVIAAARLTPLERVSLAFATLDSLPDDIASDTAAARLGAAGEPLPAFVGGMIDARNWAGWATQDELKAYALAAFEAMPPADQAAFFRHINEIEIAA